MTKTIRVPDPVYNTLKTYADKHDISIGAAAHELIQHPDLDTNDNA